MFNPPPPDTLSPGKWRSNPNRSSTRKSCASRCGCSSSPSKRTPGSPNASPGPNLSLPAVPTSSRKSTCSGSDELLCASQAVGRTLTNQFYALYADIRQRDLILRVWHVDPLRCPICRNPMRVIAVLDDPQVVEKILRHLGARNDPPAALPPPGGSRWPHLQTLWRGGPQARLRECADELRGTAADPSAKRSHASATPFPRLVCGPAASARRRDPPPRGARPAQTASSTASPARNGARMSV